MTRLVPLFVLLATTLAAPFAHAADTMTVKVKVTEGLSQSPLPDNVVFLRAARPKGPFEPTDPPPQAEFSGFTDPSGVATFSEVPADLATRGLRLQAATTYGGLTFKTAQQTPANGLTLSLPVYERGVSIDELKFSSLRTMIEPWEGFLVFTQFYQFTNAGKTAIDVAALPGEEFEKGIPIELHPLAKGIQASGPGQSTVVNSTLYWKGTLNPGESIPLQVRFSISAAHPDFVYEQALSFPLDRAEVVVPIQTRFAKVPRLSNLSLAAPGLELTTGDGILGLPGDLEFVGATGGPIARGDDLKFKLSGLPFDRPHAPWVALVLGVLSAITVLGMGRRELVRARSERGREEQRKGLTEEREHLYAELVALERDWKDNAVAERDYELESAALRERLALVLHKLEAFEDAA